ncbi:TCR/Tet family MFS transporter [Deinococcus roseus]|uniref:Tetracycline resistance MFS efflux pump n=1 Tax=Deinococcus roseus TaxID=392414 RepID=A0ABQ2CXY8_9DEIO|nr:TCR/Tet family MFS transporter [Deinococcus roseus]GGJ28132.1 tetracycline resistance MFS efflux pump [Deinococcus roseus]
MTVKRQPAVMFIFITLLIDLLGLGLVLPVMPQLVGSLSGDAARTSQVYGVLIGIYALSQLLVAPLLGVLSDRYGRRPILLGTTFLAVCAYTLLIFSPTLAWLILGRMLSGMAGASMGVANAYIADVSTPETRARNYGMVGAAFTLGFIVGPAIGGLLGQFGVRLPFMFAAGFALLNFLYGLFVLPESHQPNPQAKLALKNLIPLRSLGVLKQYPGLPALAWVTVLSSLGFQFVASTWVLHGTTRYHWGTGESGLALTVSALMGLPVQMLLVGMAMKRFGGVRTVQMALLFGALGYILYGLSSEVWMFYLAMPVPALMGLGGPALQSQVASRVPPQVQGMVQGNMASLNSLTGVLGPLAATNLFAHFATPSAHPYLPGIAFFGSALILLVCWMVYSWHAVPQIQAKQEAVSAD